MTFQEQYTLSMLKTNAKVWMLNYLQRRDAKDLERAIYHTRLALALLRAERRTA